MIRSGKDYDVTFFAWERWTTRDCKVFNSRYPILFHVFFWLGLRFPFKITQFINLQYNDIDSWLEHASFEDVLTENGDLFISMLRLPHISINLVEKKNYQSFEKAQTKRNSTRDYDRLNYQPAIWNWLPCLNEHIGKLAGWFRFISNFLNCSFFGDEFVYVLGCATNTCFVLLMTSSGLW